MPFSATILNAVQSQLAGATLPQVQAHLEDAMREFCQRTLAWKEETTIGLVAGTAEYTIIPVSAGTIVAHVIAILLNDQPLLRAENHFSVPVARQSWWSISPGRVRFDPVPAVAQTAKVTVAVMPNTTTYVMPLHFETMWHEPLVSGALARAHATMSRPYTNPLLARSYARRFRMLMVNARATVDSGFGLGTPRMQFPQYV